MNNLLYFTNSYSTKGVTKLPIKKSAFKELRKSKKRHAKNKATVSEIKSLTKKFERLISEKKASEAKALINSIVTKIDRAASKGVIHRNASSRRISRLMKKLSIFPSKA